MKGSVTFASSLLAVVVILCGCVLTELRVANHTGGQIQFYTGHTKKVKTVPAGTTVVVPHTAGRIIIIAHNDEVWEYDMVDVPQYVGDLTSGIKKLVLSISVEPDGTIVLPSGTKIFPSQTLRATQ
jgi:hypothetical protein